MLSSMSGRDSGRRNGGAGTPCGRTADNTGHTSGSARSVGRHRGMALQRRSKPPLPARSQRLSRPPTPHHPEAAVGNPDASRSFGRASGGHAPHGSPDRGGLPDSAARRRAGNDVEPSARTRQRSKSGRGRSSCRRALEPGTERTGTAAPFLPPDRLHPGGILPRHACSAPCGARRRTRTWRFRSAPCLPIRQVVIAPLCPHTLRNTAAARAARGRPCGYVDNARALPTSPQAAATTVSAV